MLMSLYRGDFNYRIMVYTLSGIATTIFDRSLESFMTNCTRLYIVIDSVWSLYLL